MPNCFSSGFLEAEPKMGILETVIYCLVHSGLGKRVDLGVGRKQIKSLVLAGDRLQYGSHWEAQELRLPLS